jgi:chitinase
LVGIRSTSIEIDFSFLREYPVSGGLPGNIHRPEDKQNYVLLLKELRQQLDLASTNDQKTYLLTVA